MTAGSGVTDPRKRQATRNSAPMWGRNVRAAMVLAGRSLDDVALELKISRKTLERTIRGQRLPRHHETTALAEALDVPESFIENGLGQESYGRPSPTDLLRTPEAFLSRTDLRELGLERRAVDSVFRALPVIALPGYSRPLVRVADFERLVEASTYDGTRVRG